MSSFDTWMGMGMRKFLPHGDINGGKLFLVPVPAGPIKLARDNVFVYLLMIKNNYLVKRSLVIHKCVHFDVHMIISYI